MGLMCGSRMVTLVELNHWPNTRATQARHRMLAVLGDYPTFNVTWPAKIFAIVTDVPDRTGSRHMGRVPRQPVHTAGYGRDDTGTATDTNFGAKANTPGHHLRWTYR